MKAILEIRLCSYIYRTFKSFELLVQAQRDGYTTKWKNHSSLRERLLDYETFAKRNSLKFPLGRLKAAIGNTRHGFIDDSD